MSIITDPNFKQKFPKSLNSVLLCFCGKANLRKQILILFFVAFVCEANAQTPKSYTSSEILLQLKKLNVLGSVLYIAAHPDDENTRLLAYLANEKLYRTGYLSLTRGDGGQNLIGDEQGVDLGLIRTQELLAARRIDGAEQFFSRAFDFGYSKSPEEALKFWGHDKILSDVVWVIRKFKPDVIITRFPTTGEGGHGHHTASAMLAVEAFDAAADPNRFPEQLSLGVTVWQAKRILWNSFNFGGTNTQREDHFKMECGDYNPMLGKSYGEIAASSRSQHRSQGFGVLAQRGSVTEYLKTIKGTAPVNDLFDGVDVSWKRTADASFANMVSKIIDKYDVSHPERSLPALVDLYKKLENLKDDYWRDQKLHAVKDIIQHSSGLFMEATTTTPYAIPDDSLKINLEVNNRSGANILSADAHINDDFIIFDQLKKNISSVQTYSMYLRPSAKYTQPYWLQSPMEKASFNVSDQQLIGKAENEPFSIDFSMMIEGKEFKFTKPVQYKYRDPVKGEMYQPVNIIPAFSVKTIPKLAVNNRLNEWEVRSFKDKNPFKSYVKTEKSRSIVGYNNDTVLAKGQIIRLFDKPQMREVTPYDKTPYFTYHDTLFQESGNPYVGLHQIEYDHIPFICYTQPEVFTSINFDLKTEGKNVGYIPGAGDKVPEALQAMGYKVVTLKETDINAANLKQFDAVVAGIRVYNENKYMAGVYNALMEYVRQGGVYLVQYSTNNSVGPLLTDKIGPAPFFISRNRITDEEAKVNFLIPDHPVLNSPNKITEKDFDGWIQERSIYEATKMDSSYKPILSMKDPGDKEQNGSLIIANYGKGSPPNR
jgi:LmbE family N-acetylglucosaminyl deacetylase